MLRTERARFCVPMLAISLEELAMDPIRLNVLVYEDGDVWVAQAIEADIAATAGNLTELPRAIKRAIVANISVNSKMGRHGLDGIPPAPAEFREKFENSAFDIRERNREMREPDGIELGDMRLVAA
jgi:hypothetical protein